MSIRDWQIILFLLSPVYAMQFCRLAKSRPQSLCQVFTGIFCSSEYLGGNIRCRTQIRIVWQIVLWDIDRSYKFRSIVELIKWKTEWNQETKIYEKSYKTIVALFWAKTPPTLYLNLTRTTWIHYNIIFILL